MTLKQRINDDMKAAMRAKDQPRLSTIRMLLAAIKQKEIDERIDLDDAGVLAVLERAIKQRRESVTQFEKAGRLDLVNGEKSELEVLNGYLPRQLGDAELAQMVEAAIAETGAVVAKDIGRVMAQLKPRLAGRAEMGKVSALVKSRLAP